MEIVQQALAVIATLAVVAYWTPLPKLTLPKLNSYNDTVPKNATVYSDLTTPEAIEKRRIAGEGQSSPSPEYAKILNRFIKVHCGHVKTYYSTTNRFLTQEMPPNVRLGYLEDWQTGEKLAIRYKDSLYLHSSLNYYGYPESPQVLLERLEALSTNLQIKTKLVRSAKSARELLNNVAKDRFEINRLVYNGEYIEIYEEELLKFLKPGRVSA